MSRSIILKVTLLFIFSSISFIFFAFYFINAEIAANTKIIEQRYDDTMLKIASLPESSRTHFAIERFLSDLGFSKIEASTMPKITRNQNTSDFLQPMMIETIKIANTYYVVVSDANSITYYIDHDNQPNKYTNYYIFAGFAFITLIFFYILVLKSLLPIIQLRKEVKKFGSGDMNINILSANDDEIGELSKEFANAAKTISDINKARVLFLRSIMHELKTPITKGRIVTEMINDTKAKERLTSIFTRLNAIIDEFAKIEQIRTKNYKMTKTKFSIIELMDNINVMLLIEDERPRNVVLKDREAVIEGDFDMMSLCVKNLVDNAIKYSTNHLVLIYTQGDSLVVQNQGKPFKSAVKQYFEPFYNDGEKNSQKGLGLGMYIIKNTTESQGFSLDYKYEKSNHYFYIKGCIVTQDNLTQGEEND